MYDTQRQRSDERQHQDILLIEPALHDVKWP